mmetsp:Transcript_29768/g.36945  ORF Transcript_29768/g.36945 Transcript_29768/m.36945 type:complete len:280 (-) Transcript_29768:423-1262(-)|eukprot:CAMPEP_0170468660 /NCGR_PEP_ID=MMETSP0123-20130129/11755_1 /TAXON_ID=182087 /ORGANISM="Favella ehrenbergii, Strain Fehren 1" /LENGTH=279 /DNA_ID=CAMNT_0010735281 /DNA_START=64 /DNA_END=903 /DNA_ORIENTATION=+
MLNHLEQKISDRKKEELAEKDTETQKVFSLIALATCAAIGFIIQIILGYYTFANPDPNSCWVVRDLASASLSKEGIIKKANDMGIDVVEGYPVNMHKFFHAWFAWGFWGNLLVTLVSIGFIVAQRYQYDKLAIVGHGINGGLYCMSSLIWLMFGAIWRFSKAGTVASGDRLERLNGQTDDQWNKSLKESQKDFGYQVSGGRFMKIFLLIAGWAITLAALMGTIMCIIMMCCDPREKGERVNNKMEYLKGGMAYNDDYTVEDSKDADEEEESENSIKSES